MILNCHLKTTSYIIQIDLLAISTCNRSLINCKKDHQYFYGLSKCTGFTLIELLVVIAIISITSISVIFSLRPLDNASLQNAEQLAAVLESARASARAQKTPLLWRCDVSGITVQSLSPRTLPPLKYNWSSALKDSVVLCNPTQGVIPVEPIMQSQTINVYTKYVSLKDSNNFEEFTSFNVNQAIQIGSDGLRPFKTLGD
jgi:general secretion pathway protein H